MVVAAHLPLDGTHPGHLAGVPAGLSRWSATGMTVAVPVTSSLAEPSIRSTVIGADVAHHAGGGANRRKIGQDMSYPPRAKISISRKEPLLVLPGRPGFEMVADASMALAV